MTKLQLNSTTYPLKYLRLFAFLVLFLNLVTPAYSQTANTESSTTAPVHKYFNGNTTTKNIGKYQSFTPVLQHWPIFPLSTSKTI